MGSVWQGCSTRCAACCLLPVLPQPTPACALQFYELARKEIGALILSDEHPNIVRCFAMEEDSEFVYLALERCRQSLADLVTGGGRLCVPGGRGQAPHALLHAGKPPLEAFRPFIGPCPFSPAAECERVVEIAPQGFKCLCLSYHGGCSPLEVWVCTPCTGSQLVRPGKTLVALH